MTNIQRERRLPVAGEVLVRKGQKVNPTDVVAEGILAPEHVLLDAARGLGVSAKKADKLMQKKAGDEVEAGDLLAGPGRFGRRVVAPRAGTIVVAGGGQILIQVESKRHELKAALTGTVIELIPDYGVVLETVGALVQGVWGNGRVDASLLTVRMKAPDDELAPDSLDVSFRGSAVLGGHVAQAEVLTTAAELPLRGMILGSMMPNLMPTAQKMPYPIILLDGFGKIPMNSAAFKLLSTSGRREVAINAEPFSRFDNSRPEVIITLPSETPPDYPLETDIFKPNQQVWVVRAPYKSKVGTLLAVRSGLATMPNGLRTYAADVRLESGETVAIPLANLEVLE
jgi:hypothetical protein